MIRCCATGLAILILCLGASQTDAAGNPAQGQRIFGACAACHSLQPDQNMTGPSLANLWGRKARSLPSFTRYSPALKSTNVTWDDKTLNEWIKDPQHLVPGNEMTFDGIKDDRQRADLLTFLKQATQPGGSIAQQDGSMGGMGGMGGMVGGMGGMMGGGRGPNLKHPDPDDRIKAISYCQDTYTVTTADGQTRKFWERNLLKDRYEWRWSGKERPALVRAGMMGDRADVIFADPSEISGFIVNKC